jgi:hypothetical protein
VDGASLGVGSWDIPLFPFFIKGWIDFVFKLKDDTQQIIFVRWFWDRRVLYAKPWHPLFMPVLRVLKAFRFG